MIMVLLSDPDSGATVRVPQADDYPGYEGWAVGAAEEWPTLAMVKAEALARVDAIREAKETGSCATPVGTVLIDEKSKTKINGALSLCRLQEELGQPFALNFTLADGSRVSLDNSSVRQMAGAVGIYVAALYDFAADLGDAINAAATAADLDAIDIETGWP